MPTERIETKMDFGELGGREIVAHFDGGEISSDAGALLLREVEKRTGIIEEFARCFTDYRSSLAEAVSPKGLKEGSAVREDK